MATKSSKKLSERAFGALVRVLDPIIKRVVAGQFEEQGFRALESRAEAIGQDPFFRTEICRAFRNLPKEAIVTERKFVSVMTDTLVQMEKTESLAVTHDAKLFAMIAHSIYLIGLESVCM